MIDESEQMFSGIVVSFDQITNGVANVSSVTEQMSASTQQVASSATELSTSIMYINGLYKIYPSK